jgi:hypothetical protein
MLARQINGVVGKEEDDLVQRKIRVRDALLVNLLAVAICADQNSRAVVLIDFQGPDLKWLGSHCLVIRLDQRNLIEQPISAACLGYIFRAFGENHFRVDPVPIPFGRAVKLCYSVFLSVIRSAAKDLRGAMRPLAVLQSSALWLSPTLIGNLL